MKEQINAPPKDRAPDKIEELHLAWSRRKVVRYVTDLVLPKFLQSVSPDACGDDLKLLHFNQRSAVYSCRIMGKTCAFKIVGPLSSPAHGVSAAFDCLNAVHRADPDQTQLAIPRPLAVYPEHATLVMEHFHARPLTDILRDGEADERRVAVGAAARWLVAYHKIGIARSKAFNSASALDPVERVLSSGKRPASDSAEKPFADALSGLRALAAQLDGTVLPSTVVHGDAKCSNFAFDGERAIGFDLHNQSHGDPASDYARLLLDAELCQTPGGRPTSSWGLGADIIDAVVGTVWPEPRPADLARLRVRLLCVALCHYLTAVGPNLQRLNARRERILSIAGALAHNDLPGRASHRCSGATISARLAQPQPV